MFPFAGILVSDYDLVLGFTCPEDIRRGLTSSLTHKSEKEKDLKSPNVKKQSKKARYTFIQANRVKTVSNADYIRP